MATAKAAAFFYLIISCNLYITNLPTASVLITHQFGQMMEHEKLPASTGRMLSEIIEHKHAKFTKVFICSEYLLQSAMNTVELLSTKH